MELEKYCTLTEVIMAQCIPTLDQEEEEGSVTEEGQDEVEEAQVVGEEDDDLYNNLS